MINLWGQMKLSSITFCLYMYIYIYVCVCVYMCVYIYVCVYIYIIAAHIADPGGGAL